MNGYIYLGARIFLDKDVCVVTSDIDNKGYFNIEHEEYLITRLINLTEISLNGYSFSGIPILKYRKMDYDLGI